MGKTKMDINEDTVRKALQGAAIRNNRELFVSHDGQIPKEYIEAAKLIRDNYEAFRNLTWKRLNAMPLTKKHFGRLIRTRLNQDGILNSPIISVVFDDYQALENRLGNIQSISGVGEFKKEYRGSKKYKQGDITDRVMRDMLAEILALDFLAKTGFENIQKISCKDKAHIDITATKDGRGYAIDVTRKQEVSKWIIDPLIGIEDCSHHSNLLEIRRLITQALDDKDDQFFRAINANTVSSSVIKVVAIKTSDYGFAECIKQAREISRQLLSKSDRWENIDCVWLLPKVDISNSYWIYRNAG